MYLLKWFNLGESWAQKGLGSISINKILELSEIGPMIGPTCKNIFYFLER